MKCFVRIGVGIGAVCLACAMIAGCGFAIGSSIPSGHRELGQEGQLLVLGDLEAIANDPELTDDQKRSRLRDLGLRDEDVIDALLAEASAGA